MPYLSRHLLLFILLSCLVIKGYSQKAVQDSDRVKSILFALKDRFAPDGRVAVFNGEITSLNPLRIYVETTVYSAWKALDSSLRSEGLHAELRGGVLPLDSGMKRYAVANLSVCNHRRHFSVESEMVTQSLLGTPMDILKMQDGYYFVRTPDHYLSWVSDDEVTAMDSLEMLHWNQASKLIAVDYYGHVFNAPQRKAEVISDFVEGDLFKFLGTKGGYWKIAFPDGRIGYVKKNLLQPYHDWVLSLIPSGENVVKKAKQFVGVPYLWGGASIKGLDCSGFTRSVYFLNGILLPRDASQQAMIGEPVEITHEDTISYALCLKNLQPGDLLFFGRKFSSGIAHIVHTAIYIGNGYFIQSSGMVRINSLNHLDPLFDRYNRKRLLSARHIALKNGSGIVSLKSLFGYRIDQVGNN